MRNPASALTAAVLSLGLVMVVLPRPGWAQNFGTLGGHVYDQSGVPLKGVQVTISSPTQIGGARTETTNDEGRLPLLGAAARPLPGHRFGPQAEEGGAGERPGRRQLPHRARSGDGGRDRRRGDPDGGEGAGHQHGQHPGGRELRRGVHELPAAADPGLPGGGCADRRGGGHRQRQSPGARRDQLLEHLYGGRVQHHRPGHPDVQPELQLQLDGQRGGDDGRHGRRERRHHRGRDQHRHQVRVEPLRGRHLGAATATSTCSSSGTTWIAGRTGWPR